MDHPKENEWLKIQFTCAVEIQTIYNYYNESLLLKHEHFFNIRHEDRVIL